MIFFPNYLEALFWKLYLCRKDSSCFFLIQSTFLYTMYYKEAHFGNSANFRSIPLTFSKTINICLYYSIIVLILLEKLGASKRKIAESWVYFKTYASGIFCCLHESPRNKRYKVWPNKINSITKKWKVAGSRDWKRQYQIFIKERLYQERSTVRSSKWLIDLMRINKIVSVKWRCPWCNGYRRKKWTRWHEFKSWARLIAFHIALIPLGKVWSNYSPYSYG